MIIPCIDLMDGKVVQLIQGRKKALEGGSPSEMLARFSAFPEIQVIDLDAALSRGSNDAILEFLMARARTRVGGGVRTVERAQRLIELGAHRIIIGTSAFQGDRVNADFLARVARTVGRDRIIVALDTKGGRIVVKGWRESTSLRAEEIAGYLEPYCGGLLCTYVDGEGLMEGTDLGWFRRLRAATALEITAAGGISTREEIQALTRLDIHAAIGMALYKPMESGADPFTALTE